MNSVDRDYLCEQIQIRIDRNERYLVTLQEYIEADKKWLDELAKERVNDG